MYCQKCGYKIKTETRTCPNCGEPLEYSEYCSGFYGILGAQNAETVSLQESGGPERSAPSAPSPAAAVNFSAAPAGGTPSPGSVQRDASRNPNAPKAAPENGMAPRGKKSSGKSTPWSIIAAAALVLSCLCLTLLIIQMFRISGLKKQLEALAPDTKEIALASESENPSSAPAETEPELPVETPAETPAETFEETSEEVWTIETEYTYEHTEEVPQSSEEQAIGGMEGVVESGETEGDTDPMNPENPENPEYPEESTYSWETTASSEEFPSEPQGNMEDISYELCVSDNDELILYLIISSEFDYEYQLVRETGSQSGQWEAITFENDLEEYSRIKQRMLEKRGEPDYNQGMMTTEEPELYLKCFRLVVNPKPVDYNKFSRGSVYINPSQQNVMINLDHPDMVRVTYDEADASEAMKELIRYLNPNEPGEGNLEQTNPPDWNYGT